MTYAVGSCHTSRAPRIFVSFLEPYDSQSTACTAVRMLAAGFAEAVPLDTHSGILLSPAAGAELLTRADLALAMERGIHLLDGPWEKLDEQAAVLSRRGTLVRRLPRNLEPFNEFYQRADPRYFFCPERFSTAEAAAYGLAVLGCVEHGRQLASRLGFEHGYVANMKMIQ